MIAGVGWASARTYNYFGVVGRRGQPCRYQSHSQLELLLESYVCEYWRNTQHEYVRFLANCGSRVGLADGSCSTFLHCSIRITVIAAYNDGARPSSENRHCASSSSPLLFQCSAATIASQPECVGKPPNAKRFERAFGCQPPATRATLPFLNLAQLYGAKTIGYYVESSPFSQSLISGARSVAFSSYGLEEVAYAHVTLTPQGVPTVESVKNASDYIASFKPDIVLAGTTTDSCIKLSNAFGEGGWIPKAALFGLCASDPNIASTAPYAKYFADYVEWDRRLIGYQYVDNLYYPPNGTLTSPQQLWNRYTTKYNVQRTPPSIGTAFSAGAVVRLLATCKFKIFVEKPFLL